MLEDAMEKRSPERHTDNYNYRRNLKVWLAGAIGPVFLAVLGYAAVSGIEWYNFGVILKVWKPQVEMRLDNLENKQDQKQEEILKEIQRLRRDMKKEK